MPDSADVIGYAKAARAYWDAGWRGILPLPPRAKKSPPDRFTGYNGVEPSYPDVLQWAEEYPGGNICLRLPDGIIGIDVDAYGVKTGAATLAEAQKRWGPLPPGPIATSRDDLISGIRLFRVPPGTQLETRIGFPEFGIGDIEIIQHHHRYVACWPSIHPEGRMYRWLDENHLFIDIPAPDELSWLPTTWIDGLKETPHELRINGDSFYDVNKALTPGPADEMVTARLRQAIKELSLPGQSRHDTTCGHVMAILRLGRNGRAGVMAALQTLRNVFVATVTSDGSRIPGEAHAEFDRMITNDNVARELSVPGVTDWWEGLRVNGERPPFEIPGTDLALTEEQEDLHTLTVRKKAYDLRVVDEARALWTRQRAALMGQEPPSMVSMVDFLSVPDEDVTYRVDDLFPVGARVLLAAQYKTGKTSLIANLLRCLVDGDQFLGRFGVAPIERVLLIDTELDERTLRRWLREQTIKNIKGINVLSLRGKLASFAITDDRTRSEWAKRISGADLIILDCLRPCLDALGLSEDKEAGIFLTAFDALCHEAGASEAVMVHHMGHSDERSRGDSRLLDWPDALWKLVRDTNDNGENIEDGDRFFMAIGRDVHVSEAQLEWQPETRMLSICGGNRTDKKAHNAISDLVEIMHDPQFAGGVSKNQLVTRLQVYGHGRNVARSAVATAVSTSVIYTAEGPNRSKVHFLNPSHGSSE